MILKARGASSRYYQVELRDGLCYTINMPSIKPFPIERIKMRRSYPYTSDRIIEVQWMGDHAYRKVMQAREDKIISRMIDKLEKTLPLLKEINIDGHFFSKYP